jgi:hypothetical protein
MFFIVCNDNGTFNIPIPLIEPFKPLFFEVLPIIFLSNPDKIFFDIFVCNKVGDFFDPIIELSDNLIIPVEIIYRFIDPLLNVFSMYINKSILHKSLDCIGVILYITV